MKNKIIKSYIFLGVLVMLLNSCKRVVEGINVDPNNPTSAPYPLVLNGAEVASFLVYEGNLARIAGIFARSFTGSDRQYVSLENYNSSSVDYNDTWDNLYATVIAQAQIVRSEAEAVNDKLTAGISQVILAQAFGLAADLWGDVPFSEAGNPDQFPTPKFDAQEDVYKGVQNLLDSAIDNLSAGVGLGPGSKDIFFGGNADKWLQTAYTLKARFYLHTKEYSNAITNALKGIDDAANNMVDPHGSSYLIDFNVYYSFLIYDRLGYMTAVNAIAPTYLDPGSDNYKGNSKTDETARFEYYYISVISNLDPNTYCPDLDASITPDINGFFGCTTSFPLVTFEENQLILAESYIKGNNDLQSALDALNTHRQYLNSGGSISTGYIPDGLEYDDYTLTDFNAGGIANPGTLSQKDALLTEVLKERYVTLIGQIEQFNDIRRTDNFLNIPPTTGDKLPQRFLYPQDEINTNPNTPELAGGDLFKETTVNATPY